MTPFSFSLEPSPPHIFHTRPFPRFVQTLSYYTRRDATRRDSPTRNPYTSRNVQFERELGEETTYKVGELSDGVNRTFSLKSSPSSQERFGITVRQFHLSILFLCSDWTRLAG